MRVRRLGDDFLDGCALDFAAAAISDADAANFAATMEASFDPEGFAARLTAAAPTGGRDLSIARRLRAAGLDVVEVDGWRSRGDPVLTPKGFTNHHTAGSPIGNAPSLGIVIRGRPDLSGPLANLFLARNRVFHVVASGRANHAGTGSFRGVSGNSLLHGCEVEHTGTKPLPDDLVEVLAIANAALGEGRYSFEMTHQHHEYSAVGKIDIAKNFHGADDPPPSKNRFREMVAEYRRELADVKRSKIEFPVNRRNASGAWVRKSVIVPTGRVDEWLAGHEAVLERRGRGSGVTVTPARTAA